MSTDTIIKKGLLTCCRYNHFFGIILCNYYNTSVCVQYKIDCDFLSFHLNSFKNGVDGVLTDGLEVTIDFVSYLNTNG